MVNWQDISHAENGFFLLAILSSFACLIRTDYNFAFALLGFYIVFAYKSKPEKMKDLSKYLLGLIGFITVADLLWIIIFGHLWSEHTHSQIPAWEDLSGIHEFAIILSWLEIGVKGLILVVLYQVYKYPSSGAKPEGYDMSPIQQQQQQQRMGQGAPSGYGNPQGQKFPQQQFRQ